MKAKHNNISKKDRRLESAAVEPSKKLAPQPNKEGLGIDLEDLHALREIKGTLEKLCCSNPSVADCEDKSLTAYKRASALLDYVGLAEIGLDAEGSQFTEPAAQWVMDSIQLQLDIVRLAGMRLYSLCEERGRGAIQTSRAA